MSTDLTSQIFDCVIVGAGIAGVSLAYELSRDRSVLVLETEAQPAYHATGRSAAFFTELFGNETIRSLTSASREFFEDPPTGFSSQPLLTPRGALYLGRDGQHVAVEKFYDEVAGRVSGLSLESAEFAYACVPILREGAVSACVFEADARQIDVDGLLQGFLRKFRTNGGHLESNARFTTAEYERGHWTVHAGIETFRGKLLIDAAGAWADEVACLVGADPVGLAPMRRTVCIIDGPKGFDIAQWPAVTDIDHSFYFLPDAGRLLLSPADETPMPPCDVYPDDIDIARAVDRLEATTTITVSRVIQQWAGLRTFAPDRTPVVGPDPKLDGFFWYAGQGGYGIQTAPALARCGAAMIRGEAVPADILDCGVSTDALRPRQVTA